jgi:hypothetical protein
VRAQPDGRSRRSGARPPRRTHACAAPRLHAAHACAAHACAERALC